MAGPNDILQALQTGVQAINNLSVQIKSIAVGRLPVVTVAQLPSAASSQGLQYMVTDATATTAYSTVAGGGANIVVVVSNGTNWVIH